MKNKILPIFIIFAVPLLYFYNETAALLTTAAAAVCYSIFSLLEQQRIKLIPNKLFILTALIIITWLFTVGRSVFVSCSFYGSFPVFIKLCVLLLISCSVSYQLASNSESYFSYYRIAAFTGFFQGLMAICEYIEAPPIPPTWLDPDSKELFRTRCCGIMTDPNIFAAFMSVLFIMTVALIINSNNKNEKIAAAVSLIMCGTGIMMTLSRGGWIALIAALAAYFIGLYISKIRPDKLSIKTLKICSVILLIIFFAGPFKYRFISITKPSDMTFFQRTLINKGIMGSITKLPIFGHGLHTFALVYPIYRIVGGDYPLYAHNEYLQSMIETGFLSSLLLLIITFYLFRLSYLAAKQKKTNTLVFSAVFVSLLIQNLSGFSSRIFPTSILIALSVGAILSSQLKTIKSIKNSRSKAIKFLNYSVILLLIIIIPGCYNIYYIQNQFYMANKALNAGKAQDAISIYENILAKQPNHPLASNSLGMLLQINKQLDKAALIWENAIKDNPLEATFPINLARLYSNNNIEKSDYYYKKAIELDPASENYRLEYAEFLIKNNKKESAKEVLQKGLTYSPGFHNVYTGFKEMEDLLAKL